MKVSIREYAVAPDLASTSMRVVHIRLRSRWFGGDALRQLTLEHLPLLIVVLLFCSARLVAWRLTRAEALAPQAPDALTVVYWPMFGIGAVIFLCFHLFRLTFFDRETGGLLAANTWRVFGREYFFSYRGASAAVAFVAFVLLSRTFGPIKSAIPELNPFSWDSEFAALDAWLHGGVDPWKIVHPLLGYPLVTVVVQYVYTFGWFVPLTGMLFFTAWAGNREQRARVLLVLVLSWILIGGAAATIFSSAGPAFFELLTGDSRYTPLLEYLHGVDDRYGLPALAVQEMLWNGHLVGGAGELGISAMPSMHVAIATLVALAAWPVNRALGVAMWIMLIVIQAGSVHLAWHYAIDGYVSIICVYALWKGCGRFVEWYFAKAKISPTRFTV